MAFAETLIGAGKQVFLDLKLHDIGNTVEKGVESVARMGATFLTVHAYPQTMKAAVAARGNAGLRILAVTVLTSYDDADLDAAGYASASPRWSPGAPRRRARSASTGSSARPRRRRRCAPSSAPRWCSSPPASAPPAPRPATRSG